MVEHSWGIPLAKSIGIMGHSRCNPGTYQWAGQKHRSRSAPHSDPAVSAIPSMSSPFPERKYNHAQTSIAALAAVAVAITGAGVLATTGFGNAATVVGSTADPATTPPPQNNAAIEWNQALLDITSAPTAPGSSTQHRPAHPQLRDSRPGDRRRGQRHRPHPPTHHRRTDRAPWRVCARGRRHRRPRCPGSAVPGPPRGPRCPAGQRSRHPAQRQCHPAGHSRRAGGRPDHPELAGTRRRRHPAPAVRGPTRAGPIPAHSAVAGDTGVHRLGIGHALRPAQRRSVPTGGAAGPR